MNNEISIEREIKEKFYHPHVSSVKMYWYRMMMRLIQKHREAAKAISILLSIGFISAHALFV